MYISEKMRIEIERRKKENQIIKDFPVKVLKVLSREINKKSKNWQSLAILNFVLAWIFSFISIFFETSFMFSYLFLVISAVCTIISMYFKNYSKNLE